MKRLDQRCRGCPHTPRRTERRPGARAPPRRLAKPRRLPTAAPGREHIQERSPRPTAPATWLSVKAPVARRRMCQRRRGASNNLCANCGAQLMSQQGGAKLSQGARGLHKQHFNSDTLSKEGPNVVLRNASGALAFHDQGLRMRNVQGLYARQTAAPSRRGALRTGVQASMHPSRVQHPPPATKAAQETGCAKSCLRRRRATGSRSTPRCPPMAATRRHRRPKTGEGRKRRRPMARPIGYEPTLLVETPNMAQRLSYSLILMASPARRNFLPPSTLRQELLGTDAPTSPTSARDSTGPPRNLRPPLPEWRRPAVRCNDARGCTARPHGTRWQKAECAQATLGRRID